MVLTKDSPAKAPRRSELGLSLVEALIAVGLIFIIAAGILPLFSRALINNNMGSVGSRNANAAREVGEYAVGSSFDDPWFAIPPGATVLVTEDNWVSDRLAADPDEHNPWEGRWFRRSPGASAVPTDRFGGVTARRIVETRQYGVGQWSNGAPLVEADALSGDTLNDYVQLKVVDIELRSEDELGASILKSLGNQRSSRVRLLKAF